MFFNKDLETRAPRAADIKLGDSRTSPRTQAVVMAPASRGGRADKER